MNNKNEEFNINPEGEVTTFGATSPSFSLTSVWGEVGTVGVTRSIPKENIDEALETVFADLPHSKNADEWVFILRSAEPVRNIYSYIRKSEELLFGTKTDTTVRDKFTISPLSLLYFQVLRAYTRADEKDFKTAKLFWQDIHINLLHFVDDYRKPFVLTHLYITSLFTRDWDQSKNYMRQLWSIIKFMDAEKRHAFGIWDEWSICLIASWCIMKVSKEFQNTFCKEIYHPFHLQKKTMIMDHLDEDSFLKSITSEAYYNKAVELMLFKEN